MTPPPANPKQRFGELKPPLALIPGTALVECSMSLKEGGNKYGPANWRKDPVEAMTYCNALLRHMMAWIDGEDNDPSSGASHLGHVMANAAILIDAQASETLLDNRPIKGQTPKLIQQRTSKEPNGSDTPSEADRPLYHGLVRPYPFNTGDD